MCVLFVFHSYKDTSHEPFIAISLVNNNGSLHLQHQTTILLFLLTDVKYNKYTLIKLNSYSYYYGFIVSEQEILDLLQNSNPRSLTYASLNWRAYLV